MTTDLNKAAVLLNGSIINDGRVQRTIKTMVNFFDVDLFYLNGNKSDKNIFPQGDIKLHNFFYDHDKNNWWRKNFLIHNIYSCFEEKIEQFAEYDVIFCNDYPTLYYGCQAKLINSKLKLIYDSHEIFTETFNQFYPDKGFRGLMWSTVVFGLKKYHKRKEKSFIPTIDKMVTVNSSLKKYFKRTYNVDSTAIYNVPFLESMEKKVSIKETLDLKDTDRIVLYQGLFNYGRGLPQLIETFALLPESYHLAFIGYGGLENELIDQATALNLKNVHFMGKVDYDDLHSFTRTADIGIFLLQSANLSKKLSSANKIFEYMKAGLPIITTNQPENRQIIELCDCGVLIESITPKDVAKRIEAMFENTVEYERMSQNSVRGFLENYNWEKEKQKLENLFVEICQ